MNNTLNTKRKLLPIITLVILLGIALILPQFTNAESNKNKDWDDKDKAELFQKHEGFQSNNGFWSRIHIDAEMCSWLPRGIAKKFTACINPQPGDDTIAPRIQSISIIKKTESSAVVKLGVNENSTARLYYDNVSGFDIDDAGVASVTSTSGSARTHEIKLSELESDTRYYFVITLEDKSGNDRISRQYSFVTREEAENDHDPEIMSLDITKTMATSATIKVVVDESVKVKVDYNIKGSSNVQSKTSSSFARQHVILLSSLSVNTEYEARVTVTDRDGNMETSRVLSFKTLEQDDTSKPVISNVEISTNLSAKTAAISWETDEASDSRIRYSSKLPFDSSASAELYSKNMVKNHSLKIEDLSANTTYSFQIESSDAAGNTTTSGYGTFNISNIF